MRLISSFVFCFRVIAVSPVCLFLVWVSIKDDLHSGSLCVDRSPFYTERSLRLYSASCSVYPTICCGMVGWSRPTNKPEREVVTEVEQRRDGVCVNGTSRHAGTVTVKSTVIQLGVAFYCTFKKTEREGQNTPVCRHIRLWRWHHVSGCGMPARCVNSHPARLYAGCFWSCVKRQRRNRDGLVARLCYANIAESLCKRG